jgi:outer membrane protein TolC
MAAEQPPLTVQQLVQIAIEVNPQVKSARAQWNSALHQIKQNYVPADPTFSYNNLDSWRGIGDPGTSEFSVSQPLQFPGKALYQGDIAQRIARIAQISYEATLRDTRAAVETGFYQALLDAALSDVITAQVADLARVLKVTQISYEANQAAQTDVISAQVDYSVAEQTLAQSRVSARNDLRQLNGLIFRHAD